MEIARLVREPVLFALHQHRHLYVVQAGGRLTVVGPSLEAEGFTLPFEPTTWSTYSGSVCLYDPEGGITQFSGTSRALQDAEPGARYSAPYATPCRDGEGLAGQVPYPPDLEEIGGAPIARAGGQVRFLTTGLVMDEEPAAVFHDPHHYLVLSRNRDRFAFHNGTWGRLLYGSAEGPLVPQVLEGVLAVGTSRGYLFSPDDGASWRERRLDGFGIPTERGIAVAREGELQLVRGSL